MEFYESPIGSQIPLRDRCARRRNLRNQEKRKLGLAGIRQERENSHFAVFRKVPVAQMKLTVLGGPHAAAIFSEKSARDHGKSYRR